MIQVLLLILKILGILLLSILGLIVLILALVLFVPFRYEVEADVNLPPDGSQEQKRIHGAAKVHWLLHLVQVRVAYSQEGGMTQALRIFFIPISLDKKNASEESGSANAEADNSENAESGAAGAEDTSAGTEGSESGVSVTEEESILPADGTNSGGETVDSESEQTMTTDDGESGGNETTETEGAETSDADAFEPTEGDNPEASEAKKPGLIQKVKGKIEKLKGKILELRDTAACMLELFSRKKGLAVEYIKKESTQTALKDVFSTVWWILKHILPRKYEGEVTFGTGDPEQTGKLFAVAAVLYPVYGTHLTVYPDMEEKVVAANGSLSGRIRLWGILYRAIRLALNKNLRRVIKQAMRVKDEMMKTPKEIKKVMGKAA